MSRIHHFEISARNLIQRVSQFKNQLGFQIFAHRNKTSGVKQNEAIALFLNSIIVIIESVEDSNEDEPSMPLPITDWISNVAIHLSGEDFKKTYHRVCNSGVNIEQSMNIVNDTDYTTTDIQRHTVTRTDSNTTSVSHGMGLRLDTECLSESIQMFSIESPFPHISHTLICGHCNCIQLTNQCTDPILRTEVEENSSDQLSNTCLTGFKTCHRVLGRTCQICDQKYGGICSIVPPPVSHVDHVTFACHTSTSQKFLKWYKNCLGFVETRFINTKDGNGFILEGSNGMRLSAMQYWMCSEKGVEFDSISDPPVQLIFAEPLPNAGRNQVQTFLDHNGVPGIQHIAFHTEDITHTVSGLRNLGISFITPPPEYYSMMEKLSAIKNTGENLDLLKENSILIDTEIEQDRSDEKIKYLLQVFSYGLFDPDTFFLEIITRRGGARGFGAGNISALWKALDIHITSQQSVDPVVDKY